MAEARESTSKPSLREEQHQRVRERIYEALIDVVVEEGPQAFTMQRLADRAGISYRTVYRHFPTRDALLDAFGEMGEEHNRAKGLEMPAELEELPAFARRLFASWDSEQRAIQAIVLIRLTTGLVDAARAQRGEVLRKAVQAFAPALEVTEIDAAAAAIKSLLSTTTWFQMQIESGMSGEQSGATVAYAVELIIEDLRTRNAARADSPAHP